MSLNSSSDTSLMNSTAPPEYYSFMACYRFVESINILTAFSITNLVLVLPAFALVICVACQRRWRQRSTSSTATAATSHSDVFTYHMVAMEMIAAVQCVLYCVTAYFDFWWIMIYSIRLFSTTWCVKIQFQTLTCVELYLAVVHPITYQRMKDTDGVRVRNISVACLWLLCLIWGVVGSLTGEIPTLVLYFCSVALALIVVSYCCFSVLRALKRPGPGEVAGGREGVDQSKQKAFHAIVTIMAVLWLCFGGMLVCDSLEALWVLNETDGCIAMTSSVWFSLPSSFVLPLLFLNRAGKLSCCRH